MKEALKLLFIQKYYFTEKPINKIIVLLLSFLCL